MNTTQKLTVHRDNRPCYDIVYAKDFLELPQEMEKLDYRNRKICVVTDTTVGPLYAQDILDVLHEGNPEAEVFTIPAGEEHKNLDTIRTIYRFLIENHYDRKSLLIALGGGVIGDMTGFVAATFLRGIDFVQIPTTLLAQADSSIGGKTGVDFEGYKNMIGAFKMPVLVYENVSVLKSLSGRQFASGFAEVMKHGLIKDEAYYVWLLDNMYEINSRDPGTLQKMLYRSNEIKKEVVEKDPYEKGERMLLNFGHTIGHAVEKYRNFSLTHGECVALGCVAASFISWKRDMLSKEVFYEIRDMFVPFGLPITEDNIDIEEVLRLTKSDKKMRGSQIRFILLSGIGHAVVSYDVTDDEIRAATKEISWTEDAQ